MHRERQACDFRIHLIEIIDSHPRRGTVKLDFNPTGPAPLVSALRDPASSVAVVRFLFPSLRGAFMRNSCIRVLAAGTFALAAAVFAQQTPDPSAASSPAQAPAPAATPTPPKSV